MEATKQIYKNRMMLLLIAGIPVTMILLATWLWYFVVRGDLDLVGMVGTANRGTLVQPPRLLDEATLVDQDGVTFHYADLEPGWTLLVPAAGASCEAACEHNLYLTRQIHLALGKDFNRVRRFFVSETPVVDTRLSVPQLSDERPAPDSFETYLHDEQRGLTALVVGTGSYRQLFSEHGGDASTWYLVDPAGWVMMSYNSQMSYKDVIADLKFLLKNSSE
jgi:cytochrome oxidase Cu insertion factor (SCO1/SenC/PrrC family)